ncbi:hypothetical protein WA1_18845 [Scytonema hofmannii PCC 7110]|uniref:Uncharacterized protein n=1 Tax=Scytonema hofmannii PCC 7110 TaxID=128403 RepID=A0A139XBJ5_9CYAN|nr:hypothetical protein [Scytonema hofmannii]KYC42061.1 hypothetical protein WA1_18845 [Scytonema hofmannii PCC 7110]
MVIQILDRGLYFDSINSPLSPKRGQIWMERNSNGDLVQEWTWNGTYWLSKTLFHASQVTTGFSGVGIASNNQWAVCPIPNNRFRGLFVVNVSIAVIFSVTVSSATDYFLFDSLSGGQIYYYNNTSAAILAAPVTGLVSINTQGGASGQIYSTQATNINLALQNLGQNQYPTSFRTLWQKQGTSGNSINVTQMIEYRLIR